MDEQERQQLADQIFLKACEIPDEQRPEFLAEACGDDAQLRELVDQLLSADADVNQEGLIVGGPAGGLGEVVRQAAADANQEAQEIAAGAADRNLLYGIVALQMNFIGRDALIQAMNQWVLSKTTPIENILVARGDMGEQTQGLLTALVDKHLEYHAGDAAKSLAALSSVEQLKKELSPIDDADLEKSLSILTEDTTSPAATTIAWGDHSGADNRSRFRVLQPYRQGGLGSVSIALDQELNRRVALKEVRKDHSHNKGFRERLRIEAEITGRLEHPGIVPVYGLGSHGNGNPFYCMRFIKGDSLKDAVSSYHDAKQSISATERNLQLRGLLRRFIDVCDAISYAHSRQVLHRDLKPGNIMLGKYGETLVVDWGLAKATAESESPSDSTERPIVPSSGTTAAPTIAGRAIGTLQYMSPEQADGRLHELGPATDVYSLGATLYCLLTGKPPISGKTEEEMNRKARRGEFPPPRSSDSTIPRPLEAICLKAMANQQGERYESASALGADIERWLADERVLAHPESLPSRVGRAIRKNRAASAAVAVGIAFTVFGLAGINFVTWKKNREIEAKNTEINRKNIELANSNRALAESQGKLQDNFRSFRTLTGSMIQKAEDDLSQKPGMEEIRDWLTKESLRVFQEFERSNPGETLTNSISVGRWLAQLFRYNSNALRNEGSIDEALAGYESALAIYNDLFEQAPDNAMVVGFMSETQRDFAITQHLAGDIEGAVRSVGEAIQHSQALLDQYPDSLSCKKLHAINHVERAEFQIHQNAIVDAFESAQLAAELLGPIIRSGEAKARDEQYLVFALLQDSACQRELGNFAEARIAVDKAMSLVAGRSDDLEQRGNRHTQARSLLEKVKVESQLDVNNSDLERWLDDAIEIWDELHRGFNGFAHYGRFLVIARTTKAELASARGNHALGADLMRDPEALARQMSESKPDYLNFENYANTLVSHSEIAARTGDNQRSRQLLQRAIKAYRKSQNGSNGYIGLEVKLARTQSKLDQFEN